MLVHTTTHASECCFQDRALRPGSLHTYAVAALNAVGEGLKTEPPLKVYVPYPQDCRTLLKLHITGEGQIQFLYGGTGGGLVTLHGGALDEDRWVHAAITQSTGQLRLIVDGTQRDSPALPDAMVKARSLNTVARGRPVYLGALGPEQDFWDCHLFDVRFWNTARPALALRKYSTTLPSRCNDILGLVSSSSLLASLSSMSSPSMPNPSYRVVSGGQPRFASVRINAPVPSHGKVYIEATVHSSGCLQVGWAVPHFSPFAASMGVGDDELSWACDGMRQMKWHGVAVSTSPTASGSTGTASITTLPHYTHGITYGKGWLWGPEHTVGCLLDMEAGTMRFISNGRDLGVAFNRYQRLMGRYRVLGPEPVQCYGGLQEEGSTAVGLPLPPGTVVHVTQTEVAEDGVLWLKLRRGWLPQLSATDDVSGRRRHTFHVERLRARRAPPQLWVRGRRRGVWASPLPLSAAFCSQGLDINGCLATAGHNHHRAWSRAPRRR